MEGLLRFGKRGKLSPRYIGPYRIVERIGKVAYRLELPSDLDRIHDVSMFLCSASTYQTLHMY